jgi:acetyl esterase/lipase
MDRVEVLKDLDYSSTDSPFLLMDVYRPPGLTSEARLPAVFFIHGGVEAGTTPKDWGVYQSWGRLVAASGMVGVTVTHRLGYPDPLLSEAAGDVAEAIEFVRARGDSLNIDQDRICLIAYSAGGPLLSPYLRDPPEYVRCLAAFYAFMDIRQSDLHRQHEPAEKVEAYSPILQLSGDRVPPLFLARAGRDEIPTMNDSIDRFVNEAVVRNIPLTFVNHPTGVHGFDNKESESERSREIIREALAFLRTHLAAGE